MRISSPSLYAVSFAVLLVQLVPFRAVSAQADGTPIRIQTTARPGKWITGMAVDVAADSLGIVRTRGAVLTRSYDTLRFARAELQRMEVSQGHKSNAGRGALIGGAVLGGAGLALGISCVGTTSANALVGYEGSAVPIIALTSAALGAGVGALLGALSHRERWGAASLGLHTEGEAGGAVSLGVSLAF